MDNLLLQILKLQKTPIKREKVTADDVIAQQDSLLKAINLIRKQNNLQSLKGSQQLNASAMEKALDLINQGYWAHQNPQGTQPWDFINQAGYDYRSAGENLARGYTDEAKMIEAWLNSPSHKENIVNPQYRDIGIGRKDGYVATHFGRPKTPTIRELDL